MTWTLSEEADCEPGTDPHVAHLYRRPESLYRAVVTWIGPALEHGGGAILIATPAHAAMVRMRLREAGFDPMPAETAGRLVVLPAAETLERFLDGGRIRGEVFQETLRDLVEGVSAACGSREVEIRAWGEMVDLLTKRGETGLAHALELEWNRALRSLPIRLLCSYDIARLDETEHNHLWRSVSETHGAIACQAASGPFRTSPRVPAALLESLDSADAPSGPWGR